MKNLSVFSLYASEVFDNQGQDSDSQGSSPRINHM